MSEFEELLKQMAEAYIENMLRTQSKETIEKIEKCFSVFQKYGFSPVQAYMILMELGTVLGDYESDN